MACPRAKVCKRFEACRMPCNDFEGLRLYTWCEEWQKHYIKGGRIRLE